SVNHQQAQMNSTGRLAEDRHDRGIGGISSGELHVVGEFIGGYSLQHQLAGISVFAFIALQWDPQQSNPNCHHEQKNNHREKPPSKSHNSVALDGLAFHGCFYSCEKGRIASAPWVDCPAL